MYDYTIYKVHRADATQHRDIDLLARSGCVSAVVENGRLSTDTYTITTANDFCPCKASDATTYDACLIAPNSRFSKDVARC